MNDNIVKKKLGIFGKIMNVIQECMGPVIPMIMAGGLIKVLVIILVAFNIISDNSDTCVILSAIGDAPYYFLPFEVAVTAAIYFKIPILLSIATVGIMFSPKFLELFASEVFFVGIPVINVTYSYSVLPVILLVWIMNLLYNWIKKIMQDSLFNFLGNTVVLLISSLLAVLVIGPIGNLIAQAIRIFILQIQSMSQVSAEVFFAIIFPFLNMLGMQWPFILDAITHVGENGYESLIIISLLCVNISQGGACLASSFRIKDNKKKSECLGMGLTAIISGASEPATYSNFGYKRPMIAALIGSGVAGLYAGIIGIKAFSFVPPAFATVLIFMNSKYSINIIHAIITGFIALVVSFLVSYILGIEAQKKSN